MAAATSFVRADSPDDDARFRKLAIRLLATNGLTVIGQADSVAAALADERSGVEAQPGLRAHGAVAGEAARGQDRLDIAQVIDFGGGRGAGGQHGEQEAGTTHGGSAE